MSGATISVAVDALDTVASLKQKVYARHGDAPVGHEQDVLLLAGKRLDDDTTLEDYSIAEESSLEILRTRTFLFGRLDADCLH